MIQTKLVRLYPTEFNINFVYCNNDKEAFKYFQDNYWIDDTFTIQEHEDAFVEDLRNHDGNKQIVCFLGQGANISEFVHECSHIIDHLSEITGMRWSYESTEQRAYLLEYIFDSFYSELLEIKSKKITDIMIEENTKEYKYKPNFETIDKGINISNPEIKVSGA